MASWRYCDTGTRANYEQKQKIQSNQWSMSYCFTIACPHSLGTPFNNFTTFKDPVG